MKKTNKSGVTLVEILIAMFLVSVAAVIVYTEMLQSYRILARSRARLEAQNIAFDYLWGIYNLPQDDLTNMTTLSWKQGSTPVDSIMYTNGTINCDIVASNVSAKVLFWDIAVTVWVPTNNPLQLGTNALAKYSVRRYRRDTE